MDLVPAPLPWLRRALGCALAALGLGLGMSDLHAQDDPAPAAGSLMPEVARQLDALAATDPRARAQGVRRVDVVVGTLDPRLKLAPCSRIEPQLPPAASLWGRTRVGLRCTDGVARWNVFVPVTVRAFGAGMVARGHLPAGTVVSAADFIQAEIDLAEEPGKAFADLEGAAGRTLARPLRPGQGLRATHLQSRQWFAAGDTVRLTALGPGFAIQGEGQALSNGVEGQPARVRTESGRVLTGIPVGQRLMELPL
jgi:flagella basal body P-ring formation protein FlgA